ncbi:hypothetical protein Tco_1094384 [Tanacetum coccineum]|uniref:Reverse transcriptase zinc-binding domain-containing protein n=1 Tax=Tanacetum coccineum TaxID=301880 RepID=A0ABQ5IFC6_9ASTR
MTLPQATRDQERIIQIPAFIKSHTRSAVWNCLRPRDAVVPWYNVVWFNYCIPRHEFHMWLVVKRRLKTHDMPRQWDIHGSLLSFQCPLCDGQPDSHEHLFFECTFAMQVWDSMKVMAGLSNVMGSITVIVDTLIPMSKHRSARSVIAKLVVAACCYYIWQERNFRLFKNKRDLHSTSLIVLRRRMAVYVLFYCYIVWHVTYVFVVVQARLEVNVNVARCARFSPDGRYLASASADTSIKLFELHDLSLDEFRTINPVFDESVYDYLGVKNSVKKLSSYGSTSSECVADQLNFWISKLNLEGECKN